MKPPQDWLDQVAQLTVYSMFVATDGGGNEWQKLLRTIQEDAWRQGMLDAAEVLKPVIDSAIEKALQKNPDHTT